MKFDYIVIGGGLCGLSAGIRLQKKGKKTAIISSGQSALHFCSGSFGLLGRFDNKIVDEPTKYFKHFPSDHPYSLIGVENIESLANEAKTMMIDAGISVYGDIAKNSYTLSPFGVVKPSWLTIDDYITFDSPEFECKKFLVIGLRGFLESYPSFIKENLSGVGLNVRVETIDLEKLSFMRRQNFDMRTVTVAKHLDKNDIEELANKINSIAGKDEVVLIPAVIGFKSSELVQYLRDKVNNNLYCIPTLPVSLAGVRSQNLLEKYFESLGGTFLLGDKVEKGMINDNLVEGVVTSNLGEDTLEAEAYILATGSLFGEGIVSNPNGFKETVFGLDIKVPESRDDWYSEDFFASQPYMNFGIEVNNEFHPMSEGKLVENLYVAGSGLANCNSLEEESGAGCAILTGMRVADLASK